MFELKESCTVKLNKLYCIQASIFKTTNNPYTNTVILGLKWVFKTNTKDLLVLANIVIQTISLRSHDS